MPRVGNNDVMECFKSIFHRKFTAEDDAVVDPEDPRIIQSAAKRQLTDYFSQDMDEIDKAEAKISLASNWWKGNTKYPELAFCAACVHSAAVVSSSLERLFFPLRT